MLQYIGTSAVRGLPQNLFLGGAGATGAVTGGGAAAAAGGGAAGAGAAGAGAAARADGARDTYLAPKALLCPTLIPATMPAFK